MQTTVAQTTLARLVLAGLAGDSGKTLISTGLVRALRRRGLRVAPFKKGPDYIDASWLTAAAAVAARNLDTYLMPTSAILTALARAVGNADIAVIEGNRGLFDGMDAEGSHSTAQLARLTGTPVVLVVNAAKVTRTVAAQILGCQVMDPKLNLAAVIINRVASRRHEAVIREAIAQTTDVPVLGAIPAQETLDLPSRHLGLVPVAEHPRAQEIVERAADLVGAHVDLDALLAVAAEAPRIEALPAAPAPTHGGPSVRIGVARDAAFSFYYPENLEGLERAGAELVFVSPLADGALPEMDALYLGGGFPEEHAVGLAENRGFREALGRRVADGMPVWAECGGLMYLARELVTGNVAHPMVGAIPVTVEQTGRPQGHGYVAARVDAPNPFLAAGTALRGHEFHYSRIVSGGDPLPTALAVQRGVGTGGGRDGILAANALACYTHIHAAGAPEWAPAMVRAARGGRW
ncbi:MAG: cobyrinate a,c-diamide synthase [Thermoanaerobaculaceae bacterium]|nr:cobyrinate a,c-diamide synthase [Thermoanaerobaculaceae bacterium]TAM46958.1 MAG: cobyrinate a,c-diamide synthase [Acidobacteriota bacterium]